MAVKPLITLLSSLDENLRREAAQSLGLIGPEAKEAIPALLAALKAGDPALLWSPQRRPISSDPADQWHVALIPTNDNHGLIRSVGGKAIWSIDPEAALKAGVQ